MVGGKVHGTMVKLRLVIVLLTGCCDDSTQMRATKGGRHSYRWPAEIRTSNSSRPGLNSVALPRVQIQRTRETTSSRELEPVYSQAKG